MGRDVAVKVLPAAAADSADRLRRFEQEARAAGTLNHPNLVTIHDSGSHEGQPYLVMELLEGETLRSRLASGRILQRKALEYALQIVRGLAVAHDKRVVHRDLKPENIFITRDGRVKVLDFGLAKLTVPAMSSDDAPTRERHGETAPGTVLGTVGYMAPEQVRGGEVDERSDIFSFGTILYEMLSGRRAFNRDSTVETMHAVLTDEPPELTGSDIHVPLSLERIVSRCMEKNPEERFRSAHDVAFVLESLMGGSSEQVAPAAAPHQRTLRTMSGPITIAAVTAAAAAVLVTWAALRDGATEPLVVSYSQLTNQHGMDMFPALAPDGSTFLFASNRTGNYDIYLQRIDGRNAINLTKDSPADDHQPAFSPDGRLVAFRSERDGGGIFIMGATGESVRRLTDLGFNPSWSPDGERLVVSSEPVVYTPSIRNTIANMHLVDVQTGESRVIPIDGVQPTISPDGSRIAYWQLSDPGQRDIWTVSVDGTDAHAVTSDAALDWNPVWAPDGKFLYFGSERAGTMGLWRIPIARNGRPRGDPQPVPVPVAFAGHFTISADGSQIGFAAIDQMSRIERHTLDAGRASTSLEAADVLGAAIMIQSWDVSPRGDWIVATNRGVQEDVHVIAVDGSDVRQITNDAARDRGPSWSPDGSEIYFYSDRGGDRYEAWKMRSDGSGLEQVTRTSGHFPWYPRLSPDGKQLLFTNQEGAFVTDATNPDATPSQIPNPDEEHRLASVQWSPDGHSIAGARVRGTDFRGIVIYSVADRSYRVVADRGAVPQWLPDGRIVYRDGATLRIAHPDGRPARTIALGGAGIAAKEQIGGFRVAADGESLFIARTLTESDIWLATLSSR
ncbi:MAG: protein kinase [Acidobacteria bacterium]|nr:protein kinase [Acidobacteriota bacterium]